MRLRIRLSFNLSMIKDVAFYYAFRSDARNPYQVELFRNQLTHGIGTKMPDVVDELNASFAEEIDPFIKEGIRPFK